MAKATGKRKTTTRSSAGRSSRKRTRSHVLRDNVILICIALLCILLFLSLIGIGGVFGLYASRIQFGMFGICAYAFPILLLFLVIRIYAKRKEKGRYTVPVLTVVLYVLICLLLQLLTGTYNKGDSVIAAFSLSISSHRGGGLTGSLLEKVIRGAFGLVGAYLIDLAGILICIVALTGKSFIELVGRKSNQAYHSSKDAAARQKKKWDTRRIERQEKREQERRSDNVFTGVSNDMTVEETTASFTEIPEDTDSGSVCAMQSQAEAVCDYAPLDAQTDETDDGQVLLPFAGSGAREPYTSYTGTEQSADSVYADHDLRASDSSADVISEEDPDDSRISGEERRSAVSDDDSSEMTEPAGVPGSSVVTDKSAAASYAMIAGHETQQPQPYAFPPLSLLRKDPKNASSGDRSAQQNMKKLQETLLSFGVDVTVTGYEQGPAVTRYELLPAPGVKVSKILSLTDDIKLALAAADVRIEAPIPGKSAIGIEVPNSTRVTVRLRELLETGAFQSHKSKIVFAAGKDISGNVILADIQKMPHLLIAGATGSGKSVCINTIIMSILYHASPDEVKLIMIDPKVVELSVYNGIPHLFTPVVTDPKKAAGALNWAVQEMTRRYQLFSQEHVRDIKSYNEKAAQSNAAGDLLMEILPQIVIIVDELADLMMVAPGEVEDAICRLAQLARAAGLHLVIATQRPSVNVITGLIKANMPSRIAFSVSSGVDSRTILDMNGAEKLLGNGDMLYYPQGLSKPKRVQGAFVTDEEVSAVVSYLKSHNEEVIYNEEVAAQELQSAGVTAGALQSAAVDDRDALYVQAGRFLIESEKGSIGSLQRKFRIGFNRAARIVDQLAEDGVLGREEGTKAREILMTAEEFEAKIREEGLNQNAAD